MSMSQMLPTVDAERSHTLGPVQPYNSVIFGAVGAKGALVKIRCNCLAVSGRDHTPRFCQVRLWDGVITHIISVYVYYLSGQVLPNRLPKFRWRKVLHNTARFLAYRGSTSDY